MSVKGLRKTTICGLNVTKNVFMSEFIYILYVEKVKL